LLKTKRKQAGAGKKQEQVRKNKTPKEIKHAESCRQGRATHAHEKMKGEVKARTA